MIDFFPERTKFTDGDLAGFLILNTLIVVAAIKSPRIRQVVSLIPVWSFVAINVYRLGGWVLLQLGMDGLLPPYIGYLAGWGDLIVGATALPVAYILYKRWAFARQIATIWVVFGLLEFTNAVVAVQLSFFGIVQFEIEPAMVGFAPMSTIVLFQSPFGILTHALLLMSLNREARSR